MTRDEVRTVIAQAIDDVIWAGRQSEIQPAAESVLAALATQGLVIGERVPVASVTEAGVGLTLVRVVG